MVRFCNGEASMSEHKRSQWSSHSARMGTFLCCAFFDNKEIIIAAYLSDTDRGGSRVITPLTTRRKVQDFRA